MEWCIIQMRVVIESTDKTLSIAAKNSNSAQDADSQIEEALKEAHHQIDSLYVSYIKANASFTKCISHKKWSALTTLSIQFCMIGDQGCKYLSQQSNFTRVVQLMLSGNQISSSGVHHLSKAMLPQLNELWLMRNMISNEGIKFINKFQCGYLKILYLDGNKLNFQDIIYLFMMQRQQLELFYIFQNQLLAKEDYLCSLATQKFPYLQQFYTR